MAEVTVPGTRNDRPFDGKNDYVGLLLAVYLGTSPIYWLPGLSVQAVAAGKFLLIAVAVVVTWLIVLRNGRARLPFDLIGPPGMVVVLLAMSPGFMQSDLATALSRFVDVGLGFLFMWTLYAYVYNGGDYGRVFRAAVLLILPFCGLVIVAGLFGFPDWQSPYLRAGYTLADTGFGGVRTGWSFGTALYLPVCLFVASSMARRSRGRWVLFTLAATFLITGSQLVVGGRSGLLASLAVVLVWISVNRSAKWLWVLPVYIGGLATLDWVWVSWRLRFDLLAGRALDFQVLNKFSASRLGVTAAAWELLNQRPLIGYGFDKVGLRSLSSTTFIHNGWLRLAVEAGVASAVATGLFAVALCAKAIKLRSRNRGTDQDEILLRDLGLALLLLVLSVLIVSLFEPGIFFGTFQLRAVLFALAGTVAALVDLDAARSGSDSGGVRL